MTKYELELLADKVSMAIKIERDKPLKKGEDRVFNENFMYLTNPISKKIHQSDKSGRGFKDWDKMTPHERTVWELSKFNAETLYRYEMISDAIIENYKKELEEKRLAEERKIVKAEKTQEKKTPELTTEQLSFNSYR